MKVRLYKNFVKRKNSTAQPANNATYTEKDVYWKEQTSIINPVLEITGFDVSFNYIYIPDWGRYYFIRDWELTNTQNVYRLYLTLDHLASYKTSIGAYTCFIERSASNYNSDIYDSALTAEDVVEVGDSASTQLFTTGTTYVLRMIGQDTTGIATYLLTSPRTLGDIFSPVLSALANGSGQNVGFLELIQSLLCDPSKYLVGAYLSPLALSEYGASDDRVYIGFYDTGIDCKRLSAAFVSQTVTLNKPTGIYTDFRKTDAAFSAYNLLLPGIGTIEISPDIMDLNLEISYCLEYATGGISYELLAGGTSVATYTGNLYAPYSVGSSDSMGGSSLLLNGAKVIGGVMSGNAPVALEGAINGTQNMLQNTPSIAYGGSSAGVHSFGTTIKLSVIQKRSAEFPTTVYGRPCCKNLQINTMSGFIKCGKADINNVAGTSVEKELINDSLNRGFYYE